MPTRLPPSSRYYLLLTLIVLFFHDALSHKQPVHQYIAREGYSLLLQRLGHDVPALSAGIGLADPSFAGDSAWQKGCVTTGAWREDEEDLVFHYDILPGLNYALTSITHFWDADQGDLNQNMFRLMLERPPLPPMSTDIGPYANTYDKLTRFAHGGWVLWYPRAFICQNTSNGHFLLITPVVTGAGFGIPLEYTDLTSFYSNLTLKVRADQPSVCVVFDANDLRSINLSEVTEIKVPDEVRNIIVWEVLGRMCHLLADMSIPAHVHRDEHGLNPDSYEDYVGGTGDPYKQWNHTNAGAPIVLNGMTSDEELHFLMYTMQEQADHFGSNGPAQGTGNDIIAGNPTQAERDFLDAVNLTSLGGPTTDAGPWTADNLDIIRDKTMPMVIRATAGLLYWFCHEAGLVETVTAIAVNERAAAEPATFTLMQNYPNPFNPLTVIKYTVGGTRDSGLGTRVKLSVYDVLAREVTVLVDENKLPGTYEVRFDAGRLVSGAYVYRLSVGSYNESRKMLLIR